MPDTKMISLADIQDIISSLNVHFVHGDENYRYANADNELVAVVPIQFTASCFIQDINLGVLDVELLNAFSLARNGHTTFVFFDGEITSIRQKITVTVCGNFITPRAQEYVPTI